MKLVAIALAVRPVSLNFYSEIMINFALSLDTFMGSWPSVRERQIRRTNCESVQHGGMFAHDSSLSPKSALPSSRGISHLQFHQCCLYSRVALVSLRQLSVPLCRYISQASGT